MYIKTTCVMRNDVREALMQAEKKTGWVMARLLVSLMRMMLRHNARYQRAYGRIEYQKRFDENTGLLIPKRRVKVKMHEREYEYFQDMRRIFRRSISLVMAIAVQEYLDLLVERILNNEFDEDRDNYPFENYAIIEKCIENITTFRIWWGLPEKMELLDT